MMNKNTYKGLKNSLPRISISLCTYNGEKYLQEQLDSFLRQIVQPFELVACDDGSTDSTFDILEQFSLKAPFKVRLFRNKENTGLTRNCSQALSLCIGDYIAFSDQDDVWLPDRLKKCYDAIQHEEHRYSPETPLLVHSDRCLIDENGHIIASSTMDAFSMRHEGVDPLKMLLARNFVSGSTCFCNKSLRERSLPFPEHIIYPDWWLAVIAASTGRLSFIPEATILYRKHEFNITGLRKTLFSLREIRKQLNPQEGISGMLKLLHQAKELDRRLRHLSLEIPPYFPLYINALQKGGIVNAFKVLFLMRIRTQGLLPNIRFFYRIARGRHIKFIG